LTYLLYEYSKNITIKKTLKIEYLFQLLVFKWGR